MKKLFALASLAIVLAAVPAAQARKLPNGWTVKARAPSCLVRGSYVPLRVGASCYGRADLSQRLGSPAPVSLRVCVQSSYSQETPSGPIPSMNWGNRDCMQYGSIVSGVWASAIKPGYSAVFGVDYEIWYRSWYSARVESAGVWYKKTGYGTAVMVPAPGQTPILG